MGAIILAIIVIASLSVIFMPRFKGLRTRLFTGLSALWLALLPILGDVLQQLTAYAPALGDLGSFLKTDMNWRAVMPDRWEPVVLLGVMALFWVLRGMTIGPVGGGKG